MTFYKLNITRNAKKITSTFNNSHRPETVSEVQDPEYLRRKERLTKRDVLVGEDVWRISSVLLFNIDILTGADIGLDGKPLGVIRAPPPNPWSDL
jgi:hypothetical protein